jgi:hypothetical protein
MTGGRSVKDDKEPFELTAYNALHKISQYQSQVGIGYKWQSFIL